MNLMQRISCAFGKHRRDRHSVWHDGDTFRSVCKGCREPMMRDYHGWHMVGEVRPERQPAGK